MGSFPSVVVFKSERVERKVKGTFYDILIAGHEYQHQKAISSNSKI